VKGKEIGRNAFWRKKEWVKSFKNTATMLKK
jgi:hypothetical protein